MKNSSLSEQTGTLPALLVTPALSLYGGILLLAFGAVVGAVVWVKKRQNLQYKLLEKEVLERGVDDVTNKCGLGLGCGFGASCCGQSLGWGWGTGIGSGSAGGGGNPGGGGGGASGFIPPKSSFQYTPSNHPIGNASAPAMKDEDDKSHSDSNKKGGKYYSSSQSDADDQVDLDEKKQELEKGYNYNRYVENDKKALEDKDMDQVFANPKSKDQSGGDTQDYSKYYEKYLQDYNKQ